MAAYNVNRGELGIVSAQTGGWSGEPENVIRLWRWDGEADPSLHMLLNTEGADPRAETRPFVDAQDNFCHRRGVHALEYSRNARDGGMLFSCSEDLLVAWAMDAETGRGTEAVRAQTPLAGTPECIRLCSDSISLVCAGRVVPGDGLPILDLGAGLTESSRLGFKADSACDIIEIPSAERGQILVGAAANRAYLWDRRSCSAPSLRLPVPSIKALGAVENDPNAFFAAAGDAVLAYDIRKLPADDPKSRTPPDALACFKASSDASLTCAAALGNVLAAGDCNGDLHVWDFGRANPDRDS